MKGLLVTYLMAYGGAVAGLLNPFIGLLAYVSFAFLKPEDLWWWSVPSGNYSRVVAIALLIGWMLQGFGRWNFGRAKRPVACLVAYLLWASLCAVRAPDRALAIAFVESAAKIVIPFLVGMTLIDSMRKLKLLAWVILLSAAYPAFELNLSYLGGYNVLKEQGFAGMDNNSYAISLVTTAGVGFFLAVYSEKWWQKGIAAGSTALVVHAVLFSFSRGGMIAMIVLGLTIFLIMPKGLKETAVFILALALAISMAGPEVRQRFMTAFASKAERDASAESRIELWSACWDLMQKNPVFGVGPNHVPLVIDQYGFKRGKEAHTLWLQIGAELGFPGLLLLASFYGTCILRLLPLAGGHSPSADLWLTHLARMVISALTGFAVAAQFVSLEALETPYYVALVGAGALKLASQSPSTSEGLPELATDGGGAGHSDIYG